MFSVFQSRVDRVELQQMSSNETHLYITKEKWSKTPLFADMIDETHTQQSAASMTFGFVSLNRNMLFISIFLFL